MQYDEPTVDAKIKKKYVLQQTVQVQVVYNLNYVPKKLYIHVYIYT